MDRSAAVMPVPRSAWPSCRSTFRSKSKEKSRFGSSCSVGGDDMGNGPTSEIEAYERLLCTHLEAFTARLRLLPPDLWDWSPDPAAPSARTLAAHTWQWLQCDRQHI